MNGQLFLKNADGFVLVVAKLHISLFLRMPTAVAGYTVFTGVFVCLSVFLHDVSEN